MNGHILYTNDPILAHYTTEDVTLPRSRYAVRLFTLLFLIFRPKFVHILDVLLLSLGCCHARVDVFLPLVVLILALYRFPN